GEPRHPHLGHDHQPATDPASTGIATPVTKDAWSEQSQVTAAATSAGSPRRFIACGRTISRRRSSLIPVISAVVIAPRQTAFTRIRSSAYSIAAFLVSPTMPCLLAV